MNRRTLPINRRIYQELREKLSGGAYPPGEPLPTEKELQQIYGVSRAPVRQALARLEAEGLVMRRAGRGTFAVHPKMAGWARLSGFGIQYNRQVEQTGGRTLAVETVACDAETAIHLGIPLETLVLKVRRVRTLEGQPVAVMSNYLAPNFGKEVFDRGGDFFSLQNFLRDQLGVVEAEVEEALEARPCPDDVAALLEVAPGHPVLFVTRFSWDNQRNPVGLSRYWVRSDRLVYRAYMSVSD